MYPNITLQIKNHVPSLVLQKSKDESSKITLEDENLLNIFAKLAKDLNLIEQERESEAALMEELLSLARESDETFILDYPEIEDEGVEFKLSNAIQKFLDKNTISDVYQDLELNPEIQAELNKNKNADTFASALDYLYVTMVAKALLAGSEMGIGIVRLDDDSKNTRLQEKMAMELERMGVDFIVE